MVSYIDDLYVNMWLRYIRTHTSIYHYYIIASLLYIDENNINATMYLLYKLHTGKIYIVDQSFTIRYIYL